MAWGNWPDKGWSTPVVWGKQIWHTTATEGGKDFFAICVDATTGKILFNERIFECATPEPLGNRLNSYASCSPVIEAGRVYVHFGSYGTACLDTENFKVIWKRDDLPCRHYRGPGSSPVLFMVTDSGIASCVDATTGAQQWQERLGGDYAASALCAGDRIYFFGQDGKTTVVKAARTFEVLATNRLNDGFMASPAVSGDALILRTRRTCIGIEE